jgi:hypothetical protein
MWVSRGLRLGALTGATALALGVLGAVPAQAAPGDWVNVSGIAGGDRYPEISNSALASIEIFGNDVQLAWTRADATSSSGVYTAIMDKKGKVTTPSTAVVTGLGQTSNYPQLVGYQGQRAVSFGTGNLGQSLATSPDGKSWTRNPGSLSATNLASASSGGGTVNSAGETLIWAGAPNLGSFTWHVGLASTNPAPPGSDQVYQPPVSGTSDVNVVYEAATNTTYGAFFARSSSAANAGTFIAQIHPTFSGFTQVPGSYVIDGSGNAQSSAAGSIVPLAARPQGGVYVGYKEGSYGGSLKIREIKSGRVIDVPMSQDADDMSLSAASNGRLWLTFTKGSQVYVAQTDQGARAFSTPVSWGNPNRDTTVYSSTIKGDNASAYVAVNVYVNRAHNFWATSVLPNLTVEKVGEARQGRTVKLLVRDGGQPVRNARVTVDGKKYKSGAGGTVTFQAPRKSSVKVVAKGPGYRDAVGTVALGR